MNSKRAYLYFILTFTLGLIVGGAATIFFGWHSGLIRPHHPDEKRIVRFLTRDLSLSDAQVQQVDQILKDTEQKNKQVQQQIQPQYDAIRAEGRDRIRKVLNPDQLAKFNQLVERIDARRRAHRQQ
jgi:hypothetical protein